MRIIAIVGGLALAATTTSLAQSGGASVPAQLDAYIQKHVKLTAAERSKMLSGAPVVTLLPSDPSREISAFGAIWIKGSPSTYVKLVKDIEQFEKGGPFRITRKISVPPQPGDFDGLVLPKDDLAALRSCRVGDCEIKLGETALRRLRESVDWSKPGAPAAAEALAKQLMLDFVKEYIRDGNDGLAIYRDTDRPTFVANELKSMIERAPELGEHLPDLKTYLLNYPTATIPGATSFIYWQEAAFGLKPTIRISHVVIDDRPGVTIIGSKLLYASHYFWTALDVRVLVEDPKRGPGFWFVTVTRSRSDGLDGFVGKVIRGKVRNEVSKSIAGVLASTKMSVERQESAKTP